MKFLIAKACTEMYRGIPMERVEPLSVVENWIDGCEEVYPSLPGGYYLAVYVTDNEGNLLGDHFYYSEERSKDHLVFTPPCNCFMDYLIDRIRELTWEYHKELGE